MEIAKKKEIIVFVLFISSLLAINSYNFIRKERFRSSHTVLIERGKMKLAVNDVGVTELESLPGIGRVLAGRIVEYRTRTGGFESLEELKQVKGIGDKLYEKIYPYLKL